MRLSNFTLSSVLSFADKPKLPYLTRPIKKKKKTRKLSAKMNTNSNLTLEKYLCVYQIHQNHSHLSHFIKVVAIFINLIQLLVFFSQNIQFRSHKSRKINEIHFSNMWVEGHVGLFTNKPSILITHIYLPTFRSFQPTCWFHIPFLS